MEAPPGKKETLLALLERSSVFIHVDPRPEAVRVPAWFKRQPQLVLQVGLNMAVPIVDLAVEDDAVSCTLSFNRAPFHCVLPWRSVFALVGEEGKGMVWPAEVPREVITGQPDAARPRPIEAVPVVKNPEVHLAVDRKGAAGSQGAPPAGPVSPSPIVARGAKGARKVAPSKKKAKAKAEPGTVAPERKAAAADASAARGEKRQLPPYLRIVK